MIITRERLIQLAEREVERQAAISDILSSYLIGSVARGEPLLGGTADVDLILIHKHRPALEHEVVRLSDDVHLDITHHSRELYENPRVLRTDPWLGPSMCEPIFLYDPEHFFEWSQAGVRGQFHRADHVHARSLEFLQRSRDSKASLNGNGTWLNSYMHAAMEGANAAASLTGFPAAGRKLTFNLERKTTELEKDEAYRGFLYLIGATEIDSWNLPEWLSACGRAYDAASKVTDNPEFESCRRDYYLRGFQALADTEKPENIVWSLLQIWELAIRTLQDAGQVEEHIVPWQSFLSLLQLTPDRNSVREDELEQYLDEIELLIEDWAEKTGA